MRLTPHNYFKLRTISNIFLLCAALLLTYLVYSPGLSGGFVFDDFPNILTNKWILISNFDVHQLWRAAFSSDAGAFKRPIAMLSFAVNHIFAGLDPYPFKLTNLFIHCINGILVFFCSRLLCKVLLKKNNQGEETLTVSLCSLATATLWLIHPFNVSTVLYVVQRMTSLSASFTLLGLCLYSIGRIKLADDNKRGWYYIASCYLVCLPLSTLTKESGLLLVLYIAIVELCITSRLHISRNDKIILQVLFFCTLILPGLFGSAFLFFKGDALFSYYEFRSFSLQERLYTELRVIFFYLKQILLPNISEMALFHDDFLISKSLFSPISTLFCGLGLLALLIFSIWKKNLSISFGILFFLGSHLLESTIVPLELVFEHRNYLGIFGLQFGLYYFFLTTISSGVTKNIVFVTLFGITLSYSYLTWQRTTDWRSPFFMAYNDALHHPLSARSNFEVAGIVNNLSDLVTDTELKRQNYELAKKFYYATINANASNVLGVFGLMSLECNHKKNIPDELIQLLGERLRTGEIPANINYLVYLLTNQLTKVNCTCDKNKIYQSIKKSLDNPKAKGNRLAATMYALAVFEMNLLQNNESAIDHLKQAIALDHGALDYRLLLIRILVALGKIGDAQEELILLKRLDTLRIYELEITQLNEQLKKQVVKSKNEESEKSNFKPDSALKK